MRTSKTMLEQLGYTVLDSSDPTQTMAMLEAYPGDVHLLITDVIMPEMSGRDLSEKVLSPYPGIKCLFMSGYTDDAIAQHGVLDKEIHFINKPFSRGQLATVVRKILDEDA